MYAKLLYTLQIATEALMNNKTRALLTSLGIIFGVASVIAMLAIGAGAQQEILDQIRLLGANNIIIDATFEKVEGVVEEGVGDAGADSEEEGETRPYSPGLTIGDAQAILDVVPEVTGISPELITEPIVVRDGRRRSGRLIGIEKDYFQTSDFELAEGTWLDDEHLDSAAPVAIIGHDVRAKFFPRDEPLGNRIKCGDLWLTVVGVLKPRNLDPERVDRLGIRNFDLDIYTPITTLLLRTENRAQLTLRDIREARRDRNRQREMLLENYHQIDRLVVQVSESAYVTPVAEVVSRLLERRHLGTVDYEVIVPEQLLQQERRTQNIFNIVLAAIASISLLVGGIGIMNIMLASVFERIREIGVRRSVGATRRDVILQFLLEAVAISFTGGMLGVLLGILVSTIIHYATGIATVVTPGSVALSFLVSVSVGLVFGLLPAHRAAEHDPVVALRHE